MKASVAKRRKLAVGAQQIKKGASINGEQEMVAATATHKVGADLLLGPG